MNLRIEQMMLSATKDMPQGYYVPPQYWEKFAELIVQECAEIVEGFTIEQEVALDHYQEYEAGSVLKEHFGVEE